MTRRHCVRKHCFRGDFGMRDIGECLCCDDSNACSRFVDNLTSSYREHADKLESDRRQCLESFGCDINSMQRKKRLSLSLEYERVE